MAEPTEADRDAAYRALWPLTRYRWPTEAEMTAEQRAQHDRVSQALADERERALRQFAGLADELAAVADCIQRAAEEAGQ